MPFVYRTNIFNAYQTQTPVPDRAITNGQTINDGDLVTFVNGRVSTAAAGGDVAGIARIYDGTTHTGNAAGTVLCDVQLLRHGDVLQVDQLAIPDAQCNAGDLLDYDANARELAAAAQNDLVVYPHGPFGGTVGDGHVFVGVRNLQYR